MIILTNTLSSSRFLFEIPSVGTGEVVQACLTKSLIVCAVSLRDIVRKT